MAPLRRQRVRQSTDMDLCHWIERHADFEPERAAIRFAGKEIGYGALAGRARRAAAAFQALGVGRGDRVAYLGFNAPEMLMSLFACARLGAMLVPLNWRLAAPEHCALVADCAPAALIAAPPFDAALDAAPLDDGIARVTLGDGRGLRRDWQAWRGLAEAAAGAPQTPVPAGPDDGVLICYTSGTTGKPKGAVLTQRGLLANALNSIHMHAMSRADRVLTTLPMFHVGGLNIQTLPALYLGATVILHDRFDPDATFDAIARERPTLTVLVPAQLNAMMASARWQEEDFSCLRAVSTGSTLVPLALIRAVFARGIPLLQVYGSTETAPVAAYHTVENAEAGIGTAGRPGLHSEIRIIDEAGGDVAPGASGEICVRGDNVIGEYWNDSAATAEAIRDGWFHSGDIGHIDERGFLVVDDRKKDIIISGGENISSAELENILAECAAVREAAVVGRADARWGEVPVAVVVAVEAGALATDQVMALFHGRVARFKHPHAVLFAETLPRNAMGKVRKDEVRAMVARTGAGAGVTER